MVFTLNQAKHSGIEVTFDGSTRDVAFVPCSPMQPVTETELRTLHRFASRMIAHSVSVSSTFLRWGALRAMASRVTKLIPTNVLDQLSALPGGKLLLRVDESLADILWETIMLNGGRLLCERFDLGREVVGKFKATRPLRQMPSGRPVRVMILADRSLPEALEEGRQLLGYLRSLGSARILAEFATDLTMPELEYELARFDIVHWCGHADAPLGRPERIGWKLADGQRFDAQAIRACRNANWPVFIFGNTCSGARVERHPKYSKSQGLAPAFREKGVTYYLGPIEPIPDSGCVRMFALRFYDAFFGEGLSIGSAVRLARRRISNDERGEEQSLGRLIAASYVLSGAPAWRLVERAPSLQLLHPEAQASATTSVEFIEETGTAHVESADGLTADFVHIHPQPWPENVAAALQTALVLSSRDPCVQGLCDYWNDRFAKELRTINQPSKSASVRVVRPKESSVFRAAVWEIAEQNTLAGRHTLAFPLYTAAGLIDQQSGDFAHYGDTCLRRAEALRRIDSLKSQLAYAYCEAGEESYREVRCESGVAYCVYRRAEIQFYRTDHVEAKANFEAIELFFVGTGQHELADSCRRYLAEIERKGGENVSS